MRALPTVVRRAGAEALALVFPVECAGCGHPDELLCASCRDLLTPVVRRRAVSTAAPAVDVWSGLPFEGVAARAVRALKSDGRTALARTLAPALAGAVAAARERAPESDVVVVPVPTSRAAMRRRGFRVPELLAVRAGLRPRRLLRLTRATGDQRALGRAARAENTVGTMTASAARGLRIVVVDDVVTTGATLAEAVRALRAAGAHVVGAATVAATPRLGHRTPSPFGTHT